MSRPYRSALYIPGSKTRALEKARGLATDIILFDLEDAVAPDEKISARDILTRELETGGYAPRLSIVRINGLDTEWGEGDASAVRNMACDAVLLPKVNSASDVDALIVHVPGLPVWAMIETPAAILNAAEIAAHPSVEGFVIGTNDLAKDLGTRHCADRSPLWTALQTSVLAARAHGVVVLDGVFNAFKDEEGLRRECEQGRDFGMDGKTLIHPAQLAIANEVFAPSAADIDLARRQIAAFEEATARGEGVAVVDGKIVENLHVETARGILSKEAAIKALEAS